MHTGFWTFVWGITVTAVANVHGLDA
jgi:hypothetical protein